MATLSGKSVADVAARFGVTESEINDWLEAEWSDMAARRSGLEVTDLSQPVRRAEGPATFFSDPDWVAVEEHIDPIAIEDPVTFGDFAVTFSDEVAHDYEDLVERSVDVIRQFPDVLGAVHSDRELITVWGPAVDRRGLDLALRAWFRSALDGTQPNG